MEGYVRYRYVKYYLIWFIKESVIWKYFSLLIKEIEGMQKLENKS